LSVCPKPRMSGAMARYPASSERFQWFRHDTAPPESPGEESRGAAPILRPVHANAHLPINRCEIVIANLRKIQSHCELPPSTEVARRPQRTADETKTTCSTIYFRARTALLQASAQVLLRVNRVDFATFLLCVRYPQYRPFNVRWDWTCPSLAAPGIGKLPAQPRQLRRSPSTRPRDMSCSCGRQRPQITLRHSPRTCSASYCPGFWSDGGFWRTIAQDRRCARQPTA